MNSQPKSSNSASAPPPALFFDTHSLNTIYANFFRASGSTDELILDFGVDAHHQTLNGPEPIVLSQRLVLSWSNAERLARMLHELIQHHNKSRLPRTSPDGTQSRT
jgi:hypothetical protein